MTAEEKSVKMQDVTPGWVKKHMCNSFSVNHVPRWQFHPDQDRRGEFTPERFFLFLQFFKL